MFRNQSLAMAALCGMLLCAAALVTQAQAQAPAPVPSQVSVGPLTFGARAGATMSWMSFSDADLVVQFEDGLTGEVPLADSRRFGAAVGVNVSYEFARRWGLEARVLLATQGSTLRGTSTLTNSSAPEAVTFGTVTMRFRTKYIYVPVLARASFGAPQGRFYVGAGPSFGFLVSAKLDQEIRVNVQGTDVRAEATEQTDVEDDMTSDVLNVSFLGGWETGGSRVRGFFEVAFDIGTTNLFSSDVGLQPVKHRGLTFMGGLGF